MSNQKNLLLWSTTLATNYHSSSDPSPNESHLITRTYGTRSRGFIWHSTCIVSTAAVGGCCAVFGILRIINYPTRTAITGNGICFSSLVALYRRCHSCIPSGGFTARWWKTISRDSVWTNVCRDSTRRVKRTRKKLKKTKWVIRYNNLRVLCVKHAVPQQCTFRWTNLSDNVKKKTHVIPQQEVLYWIVRLKVNDNWQINQEPSASKNVLILNSNKKRANENEVLVVC